MPKFSMLFSNVNASVQPHTSRTGVNQILGNKTHNSTRQIQNKQTPMTSMFSRIQNASRGCGSCGKSRK